ncbi:MAG: DUF3617 family protein [Sphingomonas sp.]|jgi:hypothetical protein|uniref:DUF3617 domain-containing protein n=1 Tax=Sphingomonas sp. TaxID=28214 RepID=UPI003561D75B
MIRSPLLLFALLPTALSAQAVSPGNWDVKSTAVELVVPGTPGFMLRMMKGRSKTDHKCVAPEQARAGAAALFSPDPKAKCSVERSSVAGGRVDQVMMCPQKKGDPVRVTRTGTYNGASFTARLIMSGQTPKGPSRVVVDQVGTHTGAKCR